MKDMTMAEINAILGKSRSADIYDTMDLMGWSDQCMDIGIKPLRADMKVAGPAFTVWGMREPLYGEELPRPDFDNWALFDKFYPGCVIVMNAEKDDVVGHWGEMMSYGARNAGAVGAVIDGNTREMAEFWPLTGGHALRVIQRRLNLRNGGGQKPARSLFLFQVHLLKQ